MEIADPERALTIAYAPPGARPAVAALWALDERLGQVVSGTRDAQLGQIRLAWWREALERLDAAPPPNEPVLRSVAAGPLAGGVAGARLGEVADGWAALLAEPLDEEALDLHAAQRGGALFAAAGVVLGAEPPWLAAAGEGWALADVAFHLRDRAVSARALTMAAERLAEVTSRRWPVRLRPLGALAMLAADDAQRGLGVRRRPGSPARVLRLLRHRITGR